MENPYTGEKALAWASFLEGYDRGKDVETLGKHRRTTAHALFERWYGLNYE